uniref:Uncharacterized protein n=1 Tax=Anopheles atroparvus TaxID=41427 RepID=A0AAG5DTV8_ANOAO
LREATHDIGQQPEPGVLFRPDHSCPAGIWWRLGRTEPHPAVRCLLVVLFRSREHNKPQECSNSTPSTCSVAVRVSENAWKRERAKRERHLDIVHQTNANCCSIPRSYWLRIAKLLFRKVNGSSVLPGCNKLAVPPGAGWSNAEGIRAPGTDRVPPVRFSFSVSNHSCLLSNGRGDRVLTHAWGRGQVKQST